MAMKKCKECGNEVSTKAESCPKCGRVLKKKMGCFKYIGLGFLILFVLGVIGSLMNDGSKKSTSDSDAKKSSVASKINEEKIFKEGDTVNIGYTSYSVFRSWWSSRLSDNQLFNEKPDAMFLFIDLAILNNDKTPRSVTPLKLIDENGAVYEAVFKGWAVKESIGVLERINPGVKKKRCHHFRRTAKPSVQA